MLGFRGVQQDWPWLSPSWLHQAQPPGRARPPEQTLVPLGRQRCQSMNEGTPGLSEAKGRTSVCPAKGRCSPGRARHPLRDGVAVGTPQCGLGAEQGAGTRARWKPGSKVPAGCTAGRTGPASHCIPLSLARQHPQLALRGPRLPLPRAAHWGPGRPWSRSRLRPGLHPCREQSQGLWGFPGGNGKAEDVLQIRHAGAAGGTAAGFGGLWETWGGCGALGWLWGSGRLRELSPPPRWDGP